MILYVKNMVCNRCKYVVKTEIEKLGYNVEQIDLGEVDVSGLDGKEDFKKISDKLEEFNFEIIDNTKSKTIEKIKKLLIELSQPNNHESALKLSSYLAKHLSKEYNYLSNLFSEVEGQTIERYFISLKIEKVKELLKYGELNLSEISWQMGYSSVAHLSKQFKQITGMTPTQFKTMSGSKRTPVENL